MNDDTLKSQAVQWLREGGDIEAAAILQRCDIVVKYVDDAFVIGSDEMITVVDLELYATRHDLTLTKHADGRFATQIENALTELFESGTGVRQTIWRGKVQSSASPVDISTSAILEVVDTAGVREAWQKALTRRATDPSGAITAARTLLETVCKYILDQAGIEYDDSVDLPKLYSLVTLQLSLAPSQHTEQAFKQVLSGCVSVVQGLATLRNRLGDAHGSGQAAARPDPVHAELAVNLAGSMAMFLVATWEAQTRESAE